MEYNNENYLNEDPMETLSYQLSQIGFYFAVVKNSDNSQYNIVQTDDIINFDSSWIADNSKWPGPDNPNPKLKKTRWFPGSRSFTKALALKKK